MGSEIGVVEEEVTVVDLVEAGEQVEGLRGVAVELHGAGEVEQKEVRRPSSYAFQTSCQ